MLKSSDPIRVLVVDDSAVVRGFLGRVIDAEPDMCVVGTAGHGRAALEVLRRKPVDVVLLDVEMPEMDGLTALPLILQAHPTLRVIMVSAFTVEGGVTTLRALRLGAADFVAKPTTLAPGPGIQAIGPELVAKIRALVRPPAPLPGTVPAAARSARSQGATAPQRAAVVGIAASTGGPVALVRLLAGLGPGFAPPVLVVQHMPPVFTRSLAETLERSAGGRCHEARDGERILPFHRYVAPGDHHMIVESTAAGPVIRLTQAPPENFCRPSADPLFHSLATLYGPAALAVVLTGMGSDGVRGVGEIARAGGRVLVQDRESSVVWGMPGSVLEAGVPATMLPLDDIAPRIRHLSSTAP